MDALITSLTVAGGLWLAVLLAKAGASALLTLVPGVDDDEPRTDP